MQKHEIFLFKDNPGIDFNKKFVVSLSMQEINSCLDKLKLKVKKEKSKLQKFKKISISYNFGGSNSTILST